MGKNIDASEIHRLKPMRDYDPECFNRMYKISKPVINNIVRHINAKRYGLSPDILQSYFFDKMLYVFNKYQGTCSEEHLKAKILLSLGVYKNKLLKKAYGENAENNINTYSLEDLFEKDKEYVEEIEVEDEGFSKVLLNRLHKYMREHLTLDAYLVFETLLTPPLFILERTGGVRKITNTLILEYFEEPVNKNTLRYITEIRKDISYWLNKLREDNEN